MSVHYQQVSKGWLVRDQDGRVAEILDEHHGLVHAVRIIKGEPSTIPEYAFNWQSAKQNKSDTWQRVVGPSFIQPYRGVY